MKDPVLPPPPLVLALVTPVADFLGLSTLPQHVHEIVFAFVFYNFIYLTVAPWLSKCFATHTYSNLPQKSRIDWDVRIVSQVQSLLILCFAFFLIFNDAQRRDTDWKERLWGYNGATGMVQAFAAGYFLWDVQVSSMHLEVGGPGSLIHAVGALAVTCLGFVSARTTFISTKRHVIYLWDGSDHSPIITASTLSFMRSPRHF